METMRNSLASSFTNTSNGNLGVHGFDHNGDYDSRNFAGYHIQFCIRKCMGKLDTLGSGGANDSAIIGCRQ